MRLRWLLFILIGLSLASGSVFAELSRLVTADGAITEIVYRLGQESRLVGVDTTSGYPEQTAELPKVGYLRALPFEGVLALKPDMLITSEQAAPARNLERLARAGVRVAQLPSRWTAEAALERILSVGELLGATEEARALVAGVEADIRRIQQNTGNRDYQPRILFILAAGNHSVMLAGSDTAANALVELIGAENAAQGIKGYKPANREAILASRPDAVVIAESTPGQFDIAGWPEVERLEAWQSGHRLVADSMFLLGFGPRLPEAMAALNDALPGQREIAANDP